MCVPYYEFHDLVTLFFADNFSTECRITMNFFTQFFSDPEVILRSHIMFINAFTKEFTLVNNAYPSHDVEFEHLLYTTRWLPMFTKNMIIFSKTTHIPF